MIQPIRCLPQFVGLALLAFLAGCDQHIELRRVSPLNVKGTLKATAAALDRDGMIVVVGVSNAFRGVSGAPELPLKESQADFVTLSADSLAAGTVTQLGPGSLWRLQRSTPPPPSWLALPGNDSFNELRDRLNYGGLDWQAVAPRIPGMQSIVTGAAFTSNGLFVSTDSFDGRPGQLSFRPLGADFVERRTPPTLGGTHFPVRFASPTSPCLLGTIITGLVSSDCGQSWQTNGSPRARIHFVVADPRVLGLLYALVELDQERMAVFRSQDGGISWQALPLPEFKKELNNRRGHSRPPPPRRSLSDPSQLGL